MPTRKEGGFRLKGETGESQPLVSIVTVVYNAGYDLPDLLQSVFQQKDQNIEFIVIDGGSQDRTVEVLQHHDSEIDYWLSEPDRGIYDAMNKGIAAARGTFILHLNAGDRLLHIPVKELEAAKTRQVDVAAFRVSIDGKHEFRPSRGMALRFNNTLHHQGTFFRKETLLPYDTQHKIFADFDVNQRLALRGARMEIFDQVVSLHTSDGISNVPSSSANAEFFRIIATNYGLRSLPFAWLLCKWRGLNSRLRQNR